MKHIRIIPLAAATLALALASAAHAQAARALLPPAAARQGPPPIPTWALSVGIAPIVAPAWQGSRDTAFSVFPDLRVNYKDTAFLSVQEGLGWNAINQDGWKIGPIAKIRFGRREATGGSPFLITGGSTALRGFGDVRLAGEFGGFAQYSPAGVLGRRVALRAELRQGTGGHTGLVADTSVRFSDRVGKFRYALGLRAAFADADYTQVYFGVSPLQGARAGLAPFRTGSGLVSAGGTGSLTRPLGQRGELGAITLFTGYDRLADAAASSTLIRQRGRRDQFSAGLAYGYRFTWN
jgi:MipA family protein